MAMAMNDPTQISKRSSHICIIISQRKEYTLFLNNVTNLCWIIHCHGHNALESLVYSCNAFCFYQLMTAFVSLGKHAFFIQFPLIPEIATDLIQVNLSLSTFWEIIFFIRYRLKYH